MSGFTLDGYTTVNERILTFYDRYPQGFISTHPAKVVEIGGAVFIAIVAEVSLAPEGPTIIAEAWEPYPGKTPYTRDSEAANGATSAIGRALGQLGIGIKAAVASADEVEARIDTAPKRPNAVNYNERQERRAAGSGKGDPLKPASEKQIDVVKRMMAAVPLELRSRTLQIITGKDSFDALNNRDIQTFFDGGKELVSKAENEAAEEALRPLNATTTDDVWAADKW